MKYFFNFLVAIILCFSANFVSAQSKIKFEVVGIENITPYFVPHLFTYHDRQVRFKISNLEKRPIKVYGSLTNDSLRPIRYYLRFDEKTQSWNYPTRDNKPVKWKFVSVT